MRIFDYFRRGKRYGSDHRSEEKASTAAADSGTTSNKSCMPLSDEMILLSDLQGSKTESDFYRYKDLYVWRCSDNKLFAFITCDTGFVPMVQYTEYLTDVLGFELKGVLGITDMTQEYSYRGYSYRLEYDSYEDIITFNVCIENETVPRCFFEAAELLKAIDVSKYKK